MNQEPVRVAQIMGKFNAGGVESVIVNYYRNINHGKVQFDFYTDADSSRPFPQELLDMGARQIVLPPYQHLPEYLSALERNLKERHYQIVHSNLNTLSVFPLFAAWRAGVPIRIAHSHSTAGGGMDFKRDMIKYALRPFSRFFATHYIACSEHAGRWLFGNVPFALMPNAIDTERFAYNPRTREEVRQSLGLENKFVIGHVGRFSPQKNHDFLLDIFQEVCKRRDDCVLMLIGGLGSAGTDIEKNLRAKVESMNLADKVLFMGTREDISDLYQAMDVFLLPSLYEGLGMAAIEAQCSGLPCVLSTRVPNEAKVIKQTCFLSLKDSPKEWAERILSFCGVARRDAAEEVRKAGFEIREQAAKYQDFILSLQVRPDGTKKK